LLLEEQLQQMRTVMQVVQLHSAHIALLTAVAQVLVGLIQLWAAAEAEA
jgi:hypothetical protein